MSKTFLFQAIQFSQTIQFNISMPLVLFNPQIWPYQVLPYRARVDLGAMAIKRCSAFPKAPPPQSGNLVNAPRILSVTSRANGMTGWMARNIISREPNVLKIYKNLIRPHIKYCTRAWPPVSWHGNWSVRRVTKIELKDYSNRGRLERLGLTTLREKPGHWSKG